MNSGENELIMCKVSIRDPSIIYKMRSANTSNPQKVSWVRCFFMNLKGGAIFFKKEVLIVNIDKTK